MLRIVVIFVLILAAPLQGLARGGVDLDDNWRIEAGVVQGQSAGDILEAVDEECCSEADLTREKPSLCKFADCKAVIVTVTLPPVDNTTDSGRALSRIDSSFEAPVDLRPPISRVSI